MAQLAPRSPAIGPCNRIACPPEATGRAVQAIQRGAVQVSLHPRLQRLWCPASSSVLPIRHSSNCALQITITATSAGSEMAQAPPPLRIRTLPNVTTMIIRLITVNYPRNHLWLFTNMKLLPPIMNYYISHCLEG